MTGVLAIATWQARQLTRSRWVPATAGIFAAGCLVTVFVGLRSLRALGLSGVGASVDALVALGVLLPPLLALVLGAGALSGAREGQLLALLASQPLRRSTLAVGAFLGVTAVVWSTIGVGYGAASLVLAGAATPGDVASLGVLVAATLAVSAAATAIGVWLGAVASSRLQAVAVAVAVWFGLALGLDLVFAGLAPGLHLGPASLLVAVLANPVEAGRILTLLASRSDPASLGPFGAYLTNRFGMGPSAAMLAGALLAWTAAPVAAACRTLHRRDI